jgi:hypothetical protein
MKLLKVKRFLLFLLFLSVSSLTIPLRAIEHTGGEEEGAKGGLEVKYQNDLVSMNVVNYPLRSVLDEVIKQTGLKITIFGPLDEKVSVRLDNFSLDKALSKIIGNRANFIFYYSQKVSGGSSPAVQLTEVKVYPQEKGGYTTTSESPPQATSEKPPSSTVAKVPLTPKDVLKKSPETGGEGMDKDKVGEDLIGALKSRDGEVRESAAYALAEIGDKKAVEPLIKSLDDENSWVRESAVRALGELRDERSIEPLKKLLSDEDGDVRESASEVLKQMTGVDYKSMSSSE